MNITMSGNQPLSVTATTIGPQGPAGPLNSNAALLSANNFTGPQNLQNHDLEEAKTVTFNVEYDNGASGTGNTTVNWENGQFQKIELTGSCTITITNPIGVCHNQLRLIQDGTGGHTVTFAGLNSGRWIGSSTQPAINSNALGETVVNMFFDGVNILQSMCRIGTT